MLCSFEIEIIHYYSFEIEIIHYYSFEIEIMKKVIT